MLAVLTLNGKVVQRMTQQVSSDKVFVKVYGDMRKYSEAAKLLALKNKPYYYDFKISPENGRVEVDAFEVIRYLEWAETALLEKYGGELTEKDYNEYVEKKESEEEAYYRANSSRFD